MARYILLSTASSWLSFAKYLRARSFLRTAPLPLAGLQLREAKWFRPMDSNAGRVIARDTQEPSKVKLPATLRESGAFQFGFLIPILFRVGVVHLAGAADKGHSGRAVRPMLRLGRGLPNPSHLTILIGRFDGLH
jgi:hypothetical protein